MSELPPFQTLIDEHAADVMAVLRGAVGREGAEDCFQETFLSALRAYPKLKDARNLRGWLITIAHHKAVDHHRARGRRAVPMADVAEIAADDGAARRAGGRAVAEPALAEAGPADGLWASDGLWAAVGTLPPKQRAAVALRYAGDLPYAEIAAALGCSPEAARRSLHEGIKRLREELG